ncbi:hypothetical protein VCHA53O466_50541 [Vibrio chagasii]|nr:hypothetical protein VCHA53O466_50541 [Vibrio chagasii]
MLCAQTCSLSVMLDRDGESTSQSELSIAQGETVKLATQTKHVLSNVDTLTSDETRFDVVTNEVSAALTLVNEQLSFNIETTFLSGDLELVINESAVTASGLLYEYHEGHKDLQKGMSGVLVKSTTGGVTYTISYSIVPH